MTNVAIIGSPADPHVSTVAEHLGRNHVNVRNIDTATIQGAAFQLSDNSHRGSMLGGVQSEWPDVVWLFRPRFDPPDLKYVAADDRAMLAADISIYTHWLLEGFAPQAKWINPFGPHIRGSNKALQASIAKECGLNVPDTLITSDPNAVRAFIEAGSTVIKPIARHVAAEGTLRRFCERMVAGMLPPDEELSIQPCFLQRELPKVAELRVHLLGSKIIAIRQCPVKAPSQVDWNVHRAGFTVAEVELPGPVCQALQAMRHRLGLMFACVDLIESLDEELYFLELNQMGRFKWFDSILPNARLSERIAKFIAEAAA